MKTFLFDTHVHTKEVSPCGKIPAAELVELYKARGYQGIVITDHYSPYGFALYEAKEWKEQVACYSAGYKLARQAGEKAGLTVLWGLELTFEGSDRNDYLVYGVDEPFLMENNNLFALDLAALHKLLKNRNALVVQAHPFRPGLTPAPPEFLDGVEVYNGNPRHDSSNAQALAYAGKHNLLMFSGSDAHQYEDVGRGGIYLPRPVQTMEEFVTLIKSNRQIALHTTTP